MIFANIEGQRVPAAPGAKATCPACSAPVIAKCGQIKIWHWAHLAKDCDPWYEPESLWHRGWKAFAPPLKQEVVMANHRADIVGTNGIVIELQHSSITPAEIKEREAFYQHMVWLIDGAPFAKNLNLREKPNYWTFRWRYPRAHHGHFKAPVFWDLEEYARTEITRIETLLESDRIEAAKVEVTLGRPSLGLTLTIRHHQNKLRHITKILSHPIFEVRKIDVTAPAGGWGVWLTKKQFIDRYLSYSLFDHFSSMRKE